MLIVYIIAVVFFVYYVTVYLCYEDSCWQFIVHQNCGMECYTLLLYVQCVTLFYSENRGDADILFYGSVSYVVIQTFFQGIQEAKVEF